MTEQGSIRCHCQPPINIPLFWGNLRRSAELQFTQLRSMWTKPSILSLSLSAFPSPFSLQFPIIPPLGLLLCLCLLFLSSFFVFLYLFAPSWFSLSCLPSLSVCFLWLAHWHTLMTVQQIITYKLQGCWGDQQHRWNSPSLISPLHHLFFFFFFYILVMMCFPFYLNMSLLYLSLPYVPSFFQANS